MIAAASGAEPSTDVNELAPEAEPAVRQRALDLSDADGNGKIDPDELDAFFAALLEAQAEEDQAKSTGPSTTVPPFVPSDGRVMPPVDTDDPRLFLVGDSVMEATAPTVEQMLPSWQTNADTRIGRRVPEGASVIEDSDDEIGDVAVIVLGHNYARGEGFQAQFNRIMRELWHLKRVVWVTVAEWSPGQTEVNAIIRTSPEVWPNIVVADWADITKANPGYLAGDRVHLNGSGVLALADLIARAVGPGPLPGGIRRVTVPAAPNPSSGGTSSVTSTVGNDDDDDEPISTGRTTTTVGPIPTTTVPSTSTTGPSTTVPPSTSTTALPTTTLPVTTIPEPTTTIIDSTTTAPPTVTE